MIRYLGDFNTWETTPSGFLGGMPLAMLVGRGDQTLAEGVGLSPLPEQRVVLSGARDLDPGEKVLLRESAVRQLPDVAGLLDETPGEGPLYVHFDTDVLNPDDAPAMNYAAPGGPSADLMAQVFDYLAQSGRVAAVSVSTWNPELDTDGRSRQTVMALLPRLLG